MTVPWHNHHQPSSTCSRNDNSSGGGMEKGALSIISCLSFTPLHNNGSGSGLDDSDLASLAVRHLLAQ
jgi:hypothetical protein